MYLVCSIYFVWLMFYEYVTNKKNTFLLFISCTFIAVLASIRYRIGTDYSTYFSIFHELLQNPESYTRVEVGWRYITYWLSFLGFNEYGCFAFWGSLTMLLVYYGLKNHAPYPLISCGFFFFGYTVGWLFNGMRQVVVCAIVLASLGVIKRREHWKALIIFLLALSIHNAAILLVPLYILVMCDRFISKYKYWILIMALCLGAGGYVINLLLISTGYIPNKAIAHSIESHLNSDVFAEQEWGIERMAIRLLLVSGIVFFKEQMGKKWEYAHVTISLYYWGNVLAFLLLSSYILSLRVCLLVKMLDILILPAFFLVTNNPILKKGIMAVIVTWCLYAFCRTLFWFNAPELVYPFRTIFGPA